VADGKDPNVPIAKEILGYFLHNPEAADSLKELSRWRLMQETVRRSVENTQEALNWLIAEGYLREETRVGTENLYVLNPARRAEAESFLEERSQSAKPPAKEKEVDR
jgi:hypothetical protein